MAKYSIFDCSMVELDKHHSDRKGNLSVVENGDTLPFDVKRVYYLYDVPGGESRGAHAHKELEQLIVAASGSFTVTLDDGDSKRSFFLNRPYQGLYVKPGLWRDLVDFSSGAVAMVLASSTVLRLPFTLEIAPVRRLLLGVVDVDNPCGIIEKAVFRYLLTSLICSALEYVFVF